MITKFRKNTKFRTVAKMEKVIFVSTLAHAIKILPKATPSRAAITGMGSCSQAPMTALP
jgi:hypothetical protein